MTIRSLILNEAFEEVRKEEYNVFLEELKFREFRLKDLNNQLSKLMKEDEEGRETEK